MMKSVCLVLLLVLTACRHHRLKKAVPKVLTGDICDMEAREYIELKKCGCRFHGMDCASFKAYVQEEPAGDKTKWKAADFHAINTDLTKEQETQKEMLKTENKPEDDFIMFDKGDNATCLAVCKALSLFKTFKEAQDYCAPDAAPPARLMKRSRKTHVRTSRLDANGIFH